MTAESAHSGATAASALLTTLDRRFWLAALIAGLAALLVLGVPSAIIPNPFFTRMTGTELFAVPMWIASSALAGLTTATYLAPSAERARGGDREVLGASVGGVGTFLAIRCPICNKVVVGVLGVTGALNTFAPLQPVLGAASVTLLGATLAWRLRARARDCERCAR